MRLIDADALLLDNTWEWFDDWGNYTGAGQIVADAPTIDAVEVVRCRDCKWSYRYETSSGEYRCYCMEHGSSGHTDDDYCSYGEKVKP